MMSSSPVIDVGNNHAPNLPTTDYAGSPRVQDGTNSGSAIVDMGAYEFTPNPYTVGETLQSSFNPASFGSPITFTARLKAGNGPPTGSVQFLDGANILANQPISADGVSSFSTAALAIGSHIITATYNPTGSFIAASANLTQTVTGLATSVALASSANPANPGQSVAFTATITNTSSISATPSGSITFFDGTTALATLPISAINSTTATASFSISTLSVGSHTISAAYTSAGLLSSVTANLTQVGNPPPSSTTLTAAPNPANYGQSVTFSATVTATSSGSASPAGNIVSTDGASVLSTQPLQPSGTSTASAQFTTAALTPGSHPITASYAATAALAASSASLTEVITGVATTAALSSSLNPAPYRQPVTFTASISSPSGAPSGTIRLMDGTLTLATLQLSPSGAAAGTASFTSQSLSVGTHSLSAVYAGSGAFQPSTANLTQTILVSSATTTNPRHRLAQP